MDLGLSRLIVCLVPKDEGDVKAGAYLGSGEFISSTEIATAYHVVKHGKCFVGKNPVTIEHADPADDFAVITTAEHSPRRLTISCAGYHEGDDYFAVGWAHGVDFAVQRFTGTRSKTRFDGATFSLLRGQSFPGQSGGAVYDRDGRLVGIVNAGPKDGTPLLASLPLRSTYLCKRSVASVDKAA
jgi:hypothetical protein